MNEIRIAVLIPCFNEEKTISKVIKDFQVALPSAKIVVCDNNSTDKTSIVAKESGAEVLFEPSKGKGNAVRKLFYSTNADIYVMADGDSTYDASSVNEMINILIKEKLDMVVGSRKTEDSFAYREGHVFGNWLLTKTVSLIFNKGFTDMLSGYRVFSDRFVRSFPLESSGFEIETEITIHALQLKLPSIEVPTNYYSRPDGSESKLNTLKDGFRILKTIVVLFKEYKPLQFFSIFSLICFVLSILISVPIIMTWIQTGLVPRIPSAILSSGLMILAFMSFFSGVILSSISKQRLEIKRLFYLNKFQ